MMSVLIALLFALWGLGLFFGISGGAVHLLLVLALAAFVVKLFQDMRAIT